MCLLHRVLMKPNLFVTLVIVCCAVAGFGQTQPTKKADIKAAVVKIGSLVQSHYVFEEQGNRIAAHLVQQFEEGKFDSVKSWTEFASLSTKILQDYGNDGHLYVRHDAKTVKELLTAPDQISEPGSDNPFFHNEDAKERNFGLEEVRILKGNFGYLKLSEINISEKSLPAVFAVFDFIANTKALILDLRDNGGGGSEIGPVLESLFLPKNVKLLEFKSRTGEVNTSTTVSWLTRKRYTNPLFIIINRKTGSAAEALTFALQANKRAMVVGQPSGGAANMNSWYVVNDEVFVSVSTSAPVLPGTNTSWERKGVQPDYVVAVGDELEYAVRKINERKP